MRFAASEPITNFLQRKENYQDLVGQAAQERAAENAAISEAEGLVARTGIQGKADVKSAKLTGEATRYAGQQAGNAAMFGGAMQGIAGLAGGAISKYKADMPGKASSFRTDLDLDLDTSINFGDYSGLFTPKP